MSCRMEETRACKNKKYFRHKKLAAGSSILMLFYYLAPCKMTPSWHHDECSSLLGTRERFTCWTRVPLPVTEKESKQEGKRIKQTNRYKFVWLTGTKGKRWKVEYANPFICMSAKWTKICISIFHPKADAPFPLLLTWYWS